MLYPKVYLAVDNCFASKRWTAPAEWTAIVRDLGLSCVEASADNECDCLYADPGYLSDWLDECRLAAEATGVRVVNFYSGHGTYATLGLSHTDRRCRERIQHEWITRMIDSAAALGAGAGFYCHAFNQATLQSQEAYSAAEAELYDRLAEIAEYAAEKGLPSIGLEQMYTPHQIPWTIDGAQRLLRELYARNGKPFYLSLDTGHQVGQRRFLMPTAEEIARRVAEFRTTGRTPGLWLGTTRAYDVFRDAVEGDDAKTQAKIGELQAEMDAHPYLFAQEEDGDLYAWARRVGRYCPIVHLQQTDGKRSAHWPFTAEYNARGIVDPARLLRSLAASYAAPTQTGYPPACERVCLTLEIFAATMDIPSDILSRLGESVSYWRRFVPRDGLALDELAAACGA
jgi:sugar phosphate isomerase/epimerase